MTEFFLGLTIGMTLAAIVIMLRVISRRLEVIGTALKGIELLVGRARR